MIRVDQLTEFGQQLIDAVNDNADLSFATVALDTAGVLTFENDQATTLVTLDTGGLEDKLLSGFATSVSGTYQLDYTDATYRYQNQILGFAAGNLSISELDGTYPRWATIYTDETAVVQKSVGAPAALPTAPTVTGLVLGYVYFPKSGDGAPTFHAKAQVPTTANFGEVLAFDGAQFSVTDAIRAGKYANKNGFQINAMLILSQLYTTADTTIDTGVTYVIAGAGTTNLTLPDAADAFDGQVIWIKNRSGGNINVIADADFDGNAGPLVVADGDSYILIYSADTLDWNIN